MGDVRSMKNNRSLRSLLRTASIAGILLLARVGAINAAGSAIPEGSLYPHVDWNVTDFLIETYGTTDWSQVTSSIFSNPEVAGNEKIFLIPLALGNAYLNRYGVWEDASDSEKALQYFEAVTSSYRIWTNRPLTPMIAHALVISVNRMHGHCDDHWDLPPVQRKRASVLWKNVKVILKDEADYRLTRNPPEIAFDSCSTADANATADAWEAALFAAAASFLPDDPQATAWDENARQLADNSTSRSSGASDEPGACAVTRELTLSDRFRPSPRVMGMRRFLQKQGALVYRIAGLPVPAEFNPTVEGLSETDPEGSAALVAPAIDSNLDKEAAFRKAFPGYLWNPTQPVPVMTTGRDLLEAIQNSKDFLYYVLVSYLRHFPAESQCPEVRYTMPEDGDGEVQ
jgi:hypothetical protein